MEENEKEKKGGVQQGTKDIFDRWNEKATIHSQDDFPIRLKKVGIRIGGIILMIILSPLLLVIFVFVVLAAL